MTTSSAVVPRRALASDRDRLVAVLAAAFSTDPVFTWLLPPGTRRREQRLRDFFAVEVPRAEGLGSAWTCTDGAGAALWYPPGRWRPTAWESLRQTPPLARVFGRRVRPALGVQRVMERHHPRRPHWYLAYLGTDPARQGTGVGSVLLRAVLETCDATGEAAYLEASTERSRALYARHGFVAEDELLLAAGGPVVHPMWREPGALPA